MMSIDYEVRVERSRRTDIIALIFSALAGLAAVGIWLTVSTIQIRNQLSTFIVQSREGRFPTTTGRVIHSSVQPGPVRTKGGRELPGYRADIRYEYEVGSRRYTGHRVNHEDFNSFKSDVAAGVVASFPVGNEVTVFHDPHDPAKALLRPGIINSGLFITLGSVAGWAFVLNCFGGWWRNRFLRAGTGCVKAFVREGRTHARLPQIAPLSLSLCVMAALFLMAQWITLGNSRHPRSAVVVMIVGAAVLVVSGAVLAGFRARWLSGVADLVIDRQAGTVTLPGNFGREPNTTIELSKIVSVKLVQVGSQTHEYRPTLYFSDPSLEPAVLATWYGRRKSMLFVLWLQEQLGKGDADV